MKIANISTYPPRECGIGTFTQNLLHSLIDADQESHPASGFIVAISDHEQIFPYPPEVKLIIQQEQQADYLEAANFINVSGADLCILQHEFGIYGGQNGVYVLPFLHRLEIPVIVILHTVLNLIINHSGTHRRLEQIINQSLNKEVVMILMRKIQYWWLRLWQYFRDERS